MNWNVIQSVLTGTSHFKSNTPCQDSIAFFNENDSCTIALADGAGSAQLSGIGSRLSCKAVIKLMKTEFDNLKVKDDYQIQLKIIHSIRTSLGITAKKREQSKEDFASTLLFVSIKEDNIIIGHIGDGVIGGICKDGTLELLSMPENGEYANMTYFTTSDNYKLHFRIKRAKLDKYKAFFLMSDGAAECLYHKKNQSFAPAISAFSSWIDKYSIEDVNNALFDNMKSKFPLHTNDDCSFIMCQQDNQPT